MAAKLIGKCILFTIFALKHMEILYYFPSLSYEKIIKDIVSLNIYPYVQPTLSLVILINILLSFLEVELSIILLYIALAAELFQKPNNEYLLANNLLLLSGLFAYHNDITRLKSLNLKKDS